jgi:hypothetical protein
MKKKKTAKQINEKKKKACSKTNALILTFFQFFILKIFNSLALFIFFQSKK